MARWHDGTIFNFNPTVVAMFAFSIFLFLPGTTLATTIVPARQAIVIDPGQIGAVQVGVINDEEETKVFVPEVDAFAIDGETGQAIFGKEEEAVAWVTGEPRQLEILPGERGVFTFSIGVPEYADSISRYLGLFARESVKEGQVAVGSRGGSLLFLHVAGPVYEELSKDDFKSDQSFYTKNEVELELRLYNNGTIHVIPEGEIILTDSKGEELGRVQINGATKKVLPRETWREKFLLGEEILANRFGKITAKASIVFGQTQKQIMATAVFWLVSEWIVGLAVSVLFILIISLSLFRLVWHRKKQL